ncbi:MAG: NAD(P)/FAD-dependent oxidoreductase [Spirochaetes bacterium]|nr:NAD(P)/FAD-dependent oxidoreductase [Spirochaetota bacterium]MBN2771945.1 NAD(P)/FAD-dependent oxidoreductase [Spirochaetota bacterium]
MKNRYDLIIIGAGSAGIVAAVHARGLRKKVLLIEKSKETRGSKFLNDIPFGSLSYHSSLILNSNKLENIGISAAKSSDGTKLFEHINEQVKNLSSHLELKNLEKMGVAVVSGEASFIDSHTVKCASKEYRAKKIIIASGSRPIVPEIDGLDSKNVLTTESLFNLKKLPGSVVIVGGGPAGIQAASAFSIMGVKTVVLEKGETILAREDDEIRAMVLDTLKKRGVTFVFKAIIENAQIEKRRCTLNFSDGKKSRRVTAERVLVCCGRKPALDNLGLESAGVEYDENGILVNRSLRTSVSNIYACGDVTGGYMYTNKAEAQASVAVVNALSLIRKKMDYSSLIWGLQTTPMVAHMGMTGSEAQARYGKFGIRIYKFPFKYSMHAALRSESGGLAKIICRPSGRILGAHVFGDNADSIVHELQIAKTNGIKFGKISLSMHIFPSYGDVLTKPSLRSYIDQYSRNILINIVRALIPHRRR